MKIFQLTLIFVLGLVASASTQAIDTVNGNHHTFSVNVSRDMVLFIYATENSVSRKGYSYVGPQTVANNYMNYSFAFNYSYKIGKHVSFIGEVGFCRQNYYAGRYNDTVIIDDNLKNMNVYDYRIDYFAVPVGFKFHFANKCFIRPYIVVQVDNSFSFSERIREVTAVRDVYNSYYSEKWHYYMLRGQISVGIDYIIRKHYVIGMDVTYKSRPWLHPDKGMITRCWYSNINFGGHVGYSF